MTLPLTVRHDSKSSVNLPWNRNDNCTNDVTELFRKDYIIWSLMVSNELSSLVPTWGAYNLLITERKNKTIVQQLPILNGCPTCWKNIYRAMKDSKKLNKGLSNYMQ